MRRFWILLVVSCMVVSSQSYTYEKPSQPFPPVQMTYVQQFPSQMYLPVQQQYLPPTQSHPNYSPSTQPTMPHFAPAPAVQQKYLPPPPAPTYQTSTNQHTYLPPPAPVNMYLPPAQLTVKYVPPQTTKLSYLPPPSATRSYLPPKAEQNYSPLPSQNYVSVQQPQQKYLPPQSSPNTYLPPQPSQNTYLPPQGSYQPPPSFATGQEKLEPPRFSQQSYLPPQNNVLPDAPSNTQQSFVLPPAPEQPSQSHLSSQRYVPPERPMIIMKNFYVHSAPEDNEEDSFTPPPVRKHYRVLFIKAPVQKNAAEALRVAQPKDEEKTVIYVLSKKTDVNDIKSHIESDVTPVSKPEVFFIKYKTHEEAEHAQHQIQAQYDALGGTSEVSNEGLAPVHSVVGSLDSTEVQQGSVENGLSSQYLPPSNN